MARRNRFESSYAPGGPSETAAISVRQERRQTRHPYFFGQFGMTSVPVTPRSVLLPPSIMTNVQFAERVLPIVRKYRLAMVNYGWNEEYGQIAVTFRDDASAVFFQMIFIDQT